MDKQTKYFLDKLQEINLEYQRETEQWLLKVYHLLLHDNLDLDVLCEIGQRFGIDLEESYDRLLEQVADDYDEVGD